MQNCSAAVSRVSRVSPSVYENPPHPLWVYHREINLNLCDKGLAAFFSTRGTWGSLCSHQLTVSISSPTEKNNNENG